MADDPEREERLAEVRARLKADEPERAERWRKMREEHLAELTLAVKEMSADELIEAHARYVGASDIQSEDVVRDEIVRLIELGRKADGNQVVTESRSEPES